MPDKRLESKICKEFITLNNKKKSDFKKVIHHTLWLSAPQIQFLFSAPGKLSYT